LTDDTRHLQEAETLAGHYSETADAYAEFWSPLIRPVGQRLLAALPWTRAARVLDVGTGTGALLRDIEKHAPTARVLGIDRSVGMLRLVPSRDSRLAVMDAMSLALGTGSFDVVVMAFMLFHLSDPVAGLTGIKRILRPGGAVGTVTWAEDPLTAAEDIWNEELDAAGAASPTAVPRYHDLMNTPEKVTHLLTTAGFAPARVWIERIEHQWEPARLIGMRTRFGAAKRRLDSLDPPARAVFLERVGRRLSGLGPEDFRYRGAAVCGVAVAT
jgi:ubiquinone/menaquinone biosynthesis C-methylase UbiE